MNREEELNSTVSQTLRRALQAAAREHHQTSSASSPPPVIVVCGTAFIMAAARSELGIIEPRDSESLSDPLSGDDKDADSQVCHSRHIFSSIKA